MEPVIVPVPAVPSDQTTTVSVRVAVTDLALVPPAPSDNNPGPETFNTTLAVTTVPAVDVRVSEALRGSTNIYPTVCGSAAVPALTTRVESAARYPRPLLRIGVLDGVVSLFRYTSVLAAVPVVSAAVTVTVNVADLPTVPD